MKARAIVPLAMFFAATSALAEPAEPTVVFDAVDPNGAQVLATRVIVDGTTVSDTINGHAVPLEPGTHKVRFESEGHTPVEMDLDVHDGDDHRVVHATLPTIGKGVAPAGSEGPPGRPFGAAPWIVMGASAAVLGTGIGLLVAGLSNISDAESRCPNRVCPNPADTDLGETGIREATAGKVLIPVGGVVLLGAVVLQFVFNSPPPARRAAGVQVWADVEVGEAGSGVVISGVF